MYCFGLLQPGPSTEKRRRGEEQEGGGLAAASVTRDTSSPGGRKDQYTRANLRQNLLYGWGQNRFIYTRYLQPFRLQTALKSQRSQLLQFTCNKNGLKMQNSGVINVNCVCMCWVGGRGGGRQGGCFQPGKEERRKRRVYREEERWSLEQERFTNDSM